MSLNDHIPYSHPLDVLRRFMPSPLKVLIEFEKEFILVETNDSSFLSSLSACGLPASPIPSPAFQWKLLRDADASGKTAEMTIVVAGSLLIASMGPACLAGVDLERKELLAFIGGEVEPQEYQDIIFPVLAGLTQFAIAKNVAIGIPLPGRVLNGSARNA